MPNFNKFIQAQTASYAQALDEVRNGRKKSHWMWYIFPQISGLGKSDTAQYYAIENLAEAQEFLQHPVLGKNLITICEALLVSSINNPHQIFGSPDDLKLKSCLTLFAAVPQTNEIFNQLLTKFFNAEKDQETLKRI